MLPPAPGAGDRVIIEWWTMPKMKTHKASKKRFRVTATGKLKRVQAGKKHLNSHKTGERKAHLRRPKIEVGPIAATYIGLMGGKN